MDKIQQQLLNHITKAQKLTLTTLRLIPEDTPGRTAVSLGWEALRLSWYMMKQDRVGIAEKKHYVQLAYDKLMQELNQ